MGSFEFLEHTADIGIRARGRSPEEALIYAARGMFAILTDPSRVKPGEEVRIELEAADREALLHDWLEELLYESQSRNMLFSRFEVCELNGNHLSAAAFGEGLDPRKHALKTEIKAVTYHRLRFEPEGEGWSATAIFDI